MKINYRTEIKQRRTGHVYIIVQQVLLARGTKGDGDEIMRFYIQAKLIHQKNAKDKPE
jgi:hypothetical protein